MCGIAGIYGHVDYTSARQRVIRMSERMDHRGPDANGVYCEDSIAFAHRRLSIIDLSHDADQPMIDVSGRYVLIFNGEIYNFKELRHSLKDYPFRTSSDTEVLLAGLSKEGMNFISRCNGMFAFALWDTKSEKLFLCRDRYGIKPLYYLRQGGEIFFASEIRSILAGLDEKPSLNRDVLAEYLRYQTVHGPATILEGVFALPPGSYMEIADNEQSIRYYHRMTETTFIPASADYTEVCEIVRHKLKQAVLRRLVSDVPLGLFLSGGIDSSALVALASGNGGSPLKTFTISFAEKRFSEAPYAEMVAAKFGTEHRNIELRPEELLKQLPDAIKAMDHPTGDGINTYVVSGIAKDAGISVALSGLGGDELFAGYPIFTRFIELQRRKWILSFPRFVRNLIGGIIEKRNPGIASAKIRSVLSQERFDLEYIYPFNREVGSHKRNESMLADSPDSENSVFRLVEEGVGYGKPGFTLPLLSQVTYAEVNTYLTNVLLRDTDQMSMAHALEVRVPFLDHELVSTVMGIPDKHKFPHTPKKLLVDSLGKDLPDEIVLRPKMGFTFPWEYWMKNQLNPFCRAMINGLAERDAFNSGSVLSRFDDFMTDRAGVTWSRIWHLCILEAWLGENGIE